MYSCKHTCVYTGCQVSCRSLPYSPRQGLSLKLEITIFFRETIWLAVSNSSFVSISTQILGYMHPRLCLTRMWMPGNHTCPVAHTANTLPYGASSLRKIQLLILTWNCITSVLQMELHSHGLAMSPPGDLAPSLCLGLQSADTIGMTNVPSLYVLQLC